MSKEPLPAEPDIFDRANGYDDEMPKGLWHMWRFICAHESGREAPETMEYLAQSFKDILAEVNQSEGRGIANRDKLINKHLPITSRKSGRTKGTTGNLREIAFSVESLMRRKKLNKTNAIEQVIKDTGASKSTVERAYRKHGAQAKYMHDIAQGVIPNDASIDNNPKHLPSIMGLIVDGD